MPVALAWLWVLVFVVVLFFRRKGSQTIGIGVLVYLLGGDPRVALRRMFGLFAVVVLVLVAWTTAVIVGPWVIWVPAAVAAAGWLWRFWAGEVWVSVTRWQVRRHRADLVDGLYLSGGRRTEQGRGIRFRGRLRNVELDKIDRRSVARKIDDLAGARCAVVELDPVEGRASLVDVTVWVSDPLIEVVHPWAFWPVGTEVPVTRLDGAVPMGFRRSGDVVTWAIWRSHWLLGGMTRYGKTSMARVRFVVLRALAMLGAPIVHFHFDFKRVELKRKAAVCAVASSSVEEAGRVVEWLAQVEIPRRQKWAEDRDLVEITADTATREVPFVDFELDEAHRYFAPVDASKGAKGEAAKRGEDLALVMREAAALYIGVVLITQRPLAELLGGARFNVDTNAAVKVRNATDAGLVLGSLPEGGSVGPHKIGRGDRFRGIVFSETDGGDGLEEWKAFYVGPEVVGRAAELSRGAVIDIGEPWNGSGGPSSSSREKEEGPPPSGGERAPRKRRARRGRRAA